MMQTLRGNDARAEFFALIVRYIRLGSMLPDGDEIDEDRIDELWLVLREMVSTKKKIDALIAEQSGSA